MPSKLQALFLLASIGSVHGAQKYEPLVLADSAGFSISGGRGAAWVAKTNPAAGTVVFRVMLGRGADDRVNAVAAGPDGTILAAGEIAENGRITGFAAELSADGSLRARHAFDKPMRAAAIGLDGGLYVAGEAEIARIGSWRLGVPGPVNALAIGVEGRVFAGGAGFVAMMEPGSANWDSILNIGGSSGQDEVRALTLDPDGGAIVAAGVTNSADFPARAAWQPRLAGDGDAFVARLRVTGGLAIEWATYLGGTAADTALGLRFEDGLVLVSGHTASTDFPASGTWNGASAGFLAAFDRAGSLSESQWTIAAGIAPAERSKTLAGAIRAARGERFAGSTTSLSSIPASPVTFGTQTTLRATVNPIAATGTVTFFDGDAILGTGTLGAGIADLPVILPRSGKRALSARYNGDPNFTPSTGTLAVTVNALVATTFQPAPASPLQGAAKVMAIGDFDRDGKPDLALGDDNVVLTRFGDGAGGFTSGGFYFTVSQPSAIAVSDFNRDGHQDLAVADAAQNRVAVLLGSASGTFTPAGNFFSVGAAPVAIAVADFNGDGTADIAVANSGSNNVTIGLGDGSGSFASAGSVPAGAQPAGIAAGQFNGALGVDLAVVNKGTNNIVILLGTGAGAFLTGATVSTGTAPEGIAVWDFDSDGSLDLVTANSGSNNVTVLRGSGAGTFTQVPGSPFPAGNAPSGVAAGDLNGDGNLDVAVSNRGGRRLTTLLGNAGGALTPLPTSPYPAGDTSIAVAIADFDRDGRADIAVANEVSPYVDILVGRLTSTVTMSSAPAPTNLGQNVTLTATVTPNTATGRVEFLDGSEVLGTAAVSGGTATLNTVMLPFGNRKLRAVYTGSGGQAIAVSPPVNHQVNGAASNGFAPPVSIPLPFTGGPASAIGDFDGDGRPDLVTAASNAIFFLRGNGSGGFITPGTTITLPGIPAGIAAVDFTSDGKLDVVAISAGGLMVLPGNGDGTFGTVSTGNLSDVLESVAASDFNLDGRPDLYVIALGAPVTVDGRKVTPPWLVQGGWQNFVTSGATAADFDGNGIPDLLAVQNDNPAQFIAPGFGDFTFVPPPPLSLVTVAPRFVLAGDFDGDGNQDGVTGDSAGFGPPQVTFQRGLGNGQLGAPVNIPVGAVPIGGVAGDFNGDGRLDFAIANNGAGTISVVLGNGNGTFQTPSTISVGSGPQQILATDLNGDRRTDLVITYTAGPNVTVLLGTGSTLSTVTIATPPPNTPFSLSPQNVSLSARVTANGTPVAPGSGTVNFLLRRGVTTIGTPGNAVPIGSNGTAATSYTLPAGLTLGPVTVVADFVPGPGFNASSDPTKTFEIIAGPPVTVTATGGANQSAAIGAVFGNPLQVTVTDAGGNPVPNILVTYTAPGSGPSATFPSGNTATTGANGTAAVAVQANATPGGFTVNATASGVPGPAGFPLTNNGPSTIAITVQTNPSGVPFTVDGVTFTTPQVFNWVPGSTHNLSAPNTLGLGGVRQAFTSWSDGLAMTHDVTPAAPTTFTATFRQQYHLSLGDSPATAGNTSASPPAPAFDNFYDAGTVVTISPVPANLVTFAGFSRDLTGATAPQNIVMSGPRSVISNYTAPGFTATRTTVATPALMPPNPAPVNITLSAVIANISGTPVPAGSGTVTFTLKRDPVTIIGTVTGVAIGANGIAQTLFQVPAGQTPGRIRITADYTGANPLYPSSDSTQFLDITPAGPASMTIVPGTNNQTTGIGTQFAQPLQVKVTDTFNSALSGVQVTFTAPAGAGASATFPSGAVAFTDNNGIASVIALANNVAGTYIVAANATGVPAANFTLTNTAVAITVGTAPTGLAFSVDGVNYTSQQTFQWAPGSTHSLSTQDQTGSLRRDTFLSWSDGGGIAHSITAGTSPAAYTATFRTEYLLTVDAFPTGSGTFTITPKLPTDFVPAGTPVTIDAIPNSGYRFAGFTGDLTGTASPGTFVMTGPKAVGVRFEPIPTQYQLTVVASPPEGGSVTPASGLRNAGAVVSINASPAPGYRFAGFNGALNGTTTPQNVTMNGPTSVTAVFVPEPPRDGGQGQGQGQGGQTQTNLGTVIDNPPQASVGTPLDFNVCPNLTAAPPLPNLTYTYSQPSNLPAGLALSSTGRLTGTPQVPGTYSFDVPGQWILSGGATSSLYTFTCRVTLTVAGQTGGLSVESGTASFSFLEESRESGIRVFRVTNRSSQPRSFSVSGDGQSWFSASGGGTIGPFGSSTFTVQAAPSGLGAGVYSGSITVNGPDGSNEKLNVGTLMTITAATQAMTLSQTGMTFVMEEGSTASVVQYFQILKSGTENMGFSLTPSTLSGGDWLRTLVVGGLVTGNTPANVGVTVNPAGLAPGTYYGQIEARSPSAANSPQVLIVVLRITPATEDPPPVVSPNGLLFIDGRSDSSAPQYISVTNVSKKPLSFSLGASFDGSPASNWFKAVAPVPTLNPGQTAFVQLTRDPAVKLPAGVARAEVVLRFATGFVRRVEVVGLVPNTTAAAAKSGTRAAAGCAPARLIPVFVTLGSGFTATAAWPSPLEVRVVDDCGDAFANGTTSISFSNGDPPLAMIHTGEGRWSGTWQPRSGAQNVVLTATSQSAESANLKGTAQIGGAAAVNSAVPAVRNGGVVSAASLAASPVAPGGYVAILGQALASGLSTSPGSPYATELGGTQVLLGGRRLSLEYVSDGRVNAIIPYEVTPNISQQLVVRRGTAYSMPETLVIAGAQPAIFTRDQSGSGAGQVTVVRNGADAAVSAENPARAGDVISIYCAGLGPVTGNTVAGSTAPGEPRAELIRAATVRVGGGAAEVRYSGLAPGLVGVYLVQAVVPEGVTAGATVPLTVTAAGVTSSPVTIAIE